MVSRQKCSFTRSLSLLCTENIDRILRLCHVIRPNLTQAVDLRLNGIVAICHALRAEIIDGAEKRLHCDAVEHDATAAAEFPIYSREDGAKVTAPASS